jgi:hypothetical protein
MEYPLKLKFKLLALAPQIYVLDAREQQVLYVKQQLFKLKEAIKVFTDDSQSRQVYAINADRIIDFSARYHFTDPNTGADLGSVKREGVKSLWKASYNVFEGERVVFTIQEENAWVKVADALFQEVPVAGMLSGYVFHPAYLVKKIDGEQVVMKLKKEPAFFEGVFSLEKHDPNLSDIDETRILLSLMMLTLLERGRG